MNSMRKVVQVSPKISLFVRSIGDVRSATDTAGSIRAAGGAFARMEAAHEEEYFCRLRAMQLQQLRERKIEEESFRLKAIEHHQEAVKRHMDAIKTMRK